MSCLHLNSGKLYDFCKASNVLMIPSIFERENFCTTEDYDYCLVLAEQFMDECEPEIGSKSSAD